VTGTLCLANKTPINWYSKKQSTIETATYGSEFVAARTCVEQERYLRNTLQYLGVPIHYKSYMFGNISKEDNGFPIKDQAQGHPPSTERGVTIFRQELGYMPGTGFTRNYAEPGSVTENIFLSRFGDDVAEYRSMTSKPVRSDKFQAGIIEYRVGNYLVPGRGTGLEYFPSWSGDVANRTCDVGNLIRWLGDRVMHQPFIHVWKIADFQETLGLADSASAIVDIEQIDLHTWTYTKELV
jgi:hypothetical protein